MYLLVIRRGYPRGKIIRIIHTLPEMQMTAGTFLPPVSPYHDWLFLVRQNRRRSSMLAGAGIQFILQQPTLHIRIKHDDTTAGPQTNDLGQLEVAGKDIAGTATHFCLKKLPIRL